MDSKSLEEWGFKEWCPLNRLAISNISETPPYEQKGTCAIRLKNTLKRKVGYSDILYIGSSKNLVRRFFKEYLGGSGGQTTQRIHKLLFEENFLEKTEISWVITENFKKLETDLKIKYYQEHGGWPPWNKIL